MIFSDEKHGNAHVDKTCVKASLNVGDVDVIGKLRREQRFPGMWRHSEKNWIGLELRLQSGELGKGRQNGIFPEFFGLGGNSQKLLMIAYDNDDNDFTPIIDMYFYETFSTLTSNI